MLELTVRAEPRQLAPIRDRIGELLHTSHSSEAHAWRVKLVACELLTLSMEQGRPHDVTLRVVPSAELTRVEVVDPLDQAPAFDTVHGRLVVRVASSWGVLREPIGCRTLWCDVTRERDQRPTSTVS